METILVTGASGYIGSHTVLELLNKGYNVVGLDNFSNSSFESLRRVQKITGKTLKFYETDIRDQEALENIFKELKSGDYTEVDIFEGDILKIFPCLRLA